MHRCTKYSLVAVAIAATGAVARRGNSGKGNDALATSKAKVPLTQAVTVAGQHANGRASRADTLAPADRQAARDNLLKTFDTLEGKA